MGFESNTKKYGKSVSYIPYNLSQYISCHAKEIQIFFDNFIMNTL